MGPIEKPLLSRRRLLQALAAVPLVSAWSCTDILPGLSIVHGAFNTVCLERNGKKLLIDSGELTSAPGGIVPEWALYTHHHRDQASGAPRLAAAGAKVVVPLDEKRFFEDAHAFWDSADNIFDHRYNFRPHLFTLREPVPVTRAVKGGDRIEWEGLTIEVIDTPGPRAAP